jgi:hypothetical protein
MKGFNKLYEAPISRQQLKKYLDDACREGKLDKKVIYRNAQFFNMAFGLELTNDELWDLGNYIVRDKYRLWFK